MTGNRLVQETSPYLLQHKDNPVHWRPWGREALDAAARENKPILLSVGYAACHWCHVMAHESFEDEETAALMNRHFVNVKVDREERPDIDQIYQTALALFGEHGGWPLTMFLTPQGEPFWGGTYFPPAPRYGRPGFRDVLQRVAEVYAQEPDKIRQNADAIRDALGRLKPQKGDGALPLDINDQVAARLAREVDPNYGGVGLAPKFPQPNILELFWRAWKRTGGEPYRTAVLHTLDRMCQGGIYDHLGGGFHRYAVDPQWLVPHFEKMLYDNAQLIDLLTLVWQETKSPLYARRVEETAAWVLREMRNDDGFASTLDADSEGEEGKFYVWQESEIDARLGDDAPAFKQAYDVRPEGNWEGKTILHRNRRPELGDDAYEETLARWRRVLFEARAVRVRPGRDDKVLADWNGLMIAALANTGAVFGRPEWVEAARRAFAFVRDRMTEDGRLKHSWREGRLRHPATLDDYANMSRAALVLFEITGETPYLEQARAWVGVLDAHYWDAEDGGYFLTADDTTDVITRTKTANDSAVPSGNGVMAEVLARLHYLTGDPGPRGRAEATVAAFAGEVARNVFPLATLLNANEFLQQAVQVVIRGRREEEDTQALLSAVHSASVPNQVLMVVPPEAELPAGHPAHGKDRRDGQATAYVCEGPVCSPPVVGPEILRETLATRVAAPAS